MICNTSEQRNISFTLKGKGHALCRGHLLYESLHPHETLSQFKRIITFFTPYIDEQSRSLSSTKRFLDERSIGEQQVIRQKFLGITGIFSVPCITDRKQRHYR